MRESILEGKLIKAVEAVGGICWKFVSPGLAGVPDRMCVFPGGTTVFVEMKAPGKKLGPLQVKRRRELHDLGQMVWVIDSEDGVNMFVRHYNI